jgi:hypothetical protein
LWCVHFWIFNLIMQTGVCFENLRRDLCWFRSNFGTGVDWTNLCIDLTFRHQVRREKSDHYQLWS